MKTITAKQAKEISDFRKENPVEWEIQDVFDTIVEEAKTGYFEYVVYSVYLNRQIAGKVVSISPRQVNEIVEFLISKGFSVASSWNETIECYELKIGWSNPRPAEEDTEETDSQEEVNVFKTS